MINECIIVEGKNDKLKILSIYPDANVFITDGSSVVEHLDFFKKIALKKDLILLLDPDYPGEKTRKIISQNIPNVKHAFIKKEDAISKNKKKIGVEHASIQVIKESLNNLITYSKPNGNKNTITRIDLYELGLLGENNSGYKRKIISDYYNLGLPNGKNFLERINLLNLTIEELTEVLTNNKTVQK